MPSSVNPRSRNEVNDRICRFKSSVSKEGVDGVDGFDGFDGFDGLDALGGLVETGIWTKSGMSSVLTRVTLRVK